MIFACCHSSLDVKSQLALTLKTLCGFGSREIAHALLTSESTIQKRLYRAREKIRRSEIPFAIPQAGQLAERLDVVMLSLYLLFNEGYNSSSGESVIRKELCLEAIRLATLLADRFEDNRKLHALLSLMCFHAARFDARIDKRGAIILFEDQDRASWNKELINAGMHHLKRSIYDETLTPYHVEARIAAEHCLAGSFEQTNWEVIYDQYVMLDQLKPNPVIKLNLAIIQSKLKGIEESLLLLKDLSNHPELKEYHLLPATQGIFYMKLKNYPKAVEFLTHSLTLNPSERERAFIESKIVECKKLLPAR